LLAACARALRDFVRTSIDVAATNGEEAAALLASQPASERGKEGRERGAMLLLLHIDRLLLLLFPTSAEHSFDAVLHSACTAKQRD
jgi:hypothetical protein